VIIQDDVTIIYFYSKKIIFIKVKPHQSGSIFTQ